MSIFKIGGTHVEPTFFETLYIFKCQKKKCAHKFFEKFVGTQLRPIFIHHLLTNRRSAM